MGKAVKLIDEHTLKGMLVAIGNHSLEIGAIIKLTALSAVNIFTHNGVIVRFGIFLTDL